MAEGIPVVGGGGDQAAGAVGNGIVTPGIVTATLGTSGVVFAHSDQPTRDPQGRVHTMCHAVPGKWCVFGCMLVGRRELPVVPQPARRTTKSRRRRRRRSTRTSCSSPRPTKRPPGCEGLFFLPYLTGERCPHPDPNARGGWIGLTARTTPRHADPLAARRRHLRHARRPGDHAADEHPHHARSAPAAAGRAATSGGSSRPTSTSSPIVLTNATEGPAYGVALLAGVGTGVWKSVEEACKRVDQADPKDLPEQESRRAVRPPLPRLRQALRRPEGPLRRDGVAVIAD